MAGSYALKLEDGLYEKIKEQIMSEYLQVRKDRVMELAAGSPIFKKCAKMLWPEELEEIPLIGKMGDIYKRGNDPYILARTKIEAESLFVLINLLNGNLWDEPFSAEHSHQIPLPKSFTRNAEVELMTGRINLARQLEG